MTRYLITGGAGFIGSALAWRLSADGHEVTVLDDFSRGQIGRLAGTGAQIFEGDVRSGGAVARAMQGCDSVIHAAFLQGTARFYSQPRQVLDVAVRGMSAVLAACELTGCRDLVLISSSEAYQVAPVVPTPEDIPLVVPDVRNPRYSYGGGKIISELMAQAWLDAGTLDRAVIARPHNVYGPDMGREHVLPHFALRMARAHREQPRGVIGFPIQGSGLETRSFVFVDDCMAQLAAVCEKGGAGEVYHVGGEDERTIGSVALDVAACFGREARIEPGELPEGSPPRRLPDTGKVRALGAPLPQVSWDDGLARTVAWYREHEDG